jgi:hypothetical protein
MKRFLRYVFYRELYKWLRNVGNDDGNSTQRDSAGTTNSSAGQIEELPLDEGPIENTGELKTVLQQMDPYDFEHFIADLWTRMGWQTDVSTASIDKGVDVTARKQQPYEQTTLIQAKRYGPNTTVGSPDIQQYASLSQQYNNVDKVVVVTTNEFTSQARELADQLNVKLIDGDDLASLVVEQDALDLVDDYLEFVTTAESDHPRNYPQQGADGMDNEQQAGTEADTDDRAVTPDRVSVVVSSTVWEKAVMIAIPGWLVAFFGVEFLPEALWGIVFFAVWLGLPVALFLDARYVRERQDWPQYWWAYVGTSLVWLLAIIPAGLYLWRRRSLDESADAEADVSQPHGTETSKATPSSEATPAESQTDSVSSADTAAAPSERTEFSSQDYSGESAGDTLADRMDIEYNGETYVAQAVTSPNGEYTAAYRDGRSGAGSRDAEAGRVFLFEGDELQFTTEIDRPNACAVANNGTTAVVDWRDWGDTLSGALHVFNESGHRFVNHEFDSNIGPVALTPDGSYAATSTFNPDCSTYVFDVAAGEQLLRHENQHGNVQQLTFVDRDGSWMLRLGASDDDSGYGIDLGGHVVWKSEEVQRQERLERLLESSDEADLDDALELLEQAMVAASEDYEERNVAQQLAETHWKLAKTIKREDGVTDEWWSHLDQAGQYFREILPRYAGKQGLAKVRRQQGKQHLDQGNDTAARECFEEIADLEAEYEVQLLTDADERRLDELQERAT